jgi:hypothetical protein
LDIRRSSAIVITDSTISSILHFLCVIESIMSSINPLSEPIEANIGLGEIASAIPDK